MMLLLLLLLGLASMAVLRRVGQCLGRDMP